MFFIALDDPHVSALVEALNQEHEKDFLDFTARAFRDNPRQAELSAEAISRTYYKICNYLQNHEFDGDLRRLYAFAIVILRNTISDIGRELERNREDVAHIPPPRHGLDDVLNRLCEQEDRESVRQMVERLPERDRNLLFLRYTMEMSPDEIAHELQIPVSTVYTRLRRALAKCRKRLSASAKK